MNNAKSWKSIKQTFNTLRSSSLAEPRFRKNTLQSAKKDFVKSKFVSDVRRENDANITIEDSDEENDNGEPIPRRKTPLRASSVLKPLDGIINISKQTSKIVESDDSNDTVIHDPDYDESSLCQSMECVHNTSIKNSLKLSTTKTATNSVIKTNTIKRQSDTPVSIKQDFEKLRNAFDGSISSCNEKKELENSILDSDSDPNNVENTSHNSNRNKKKKKKQGKINELAIFSDISNTVGEQNKVNAEFLIDTESSVHSSKPTQSLQEKDLTPVLQAIQPTPKRRKIAKGAKGSLVEQLRKAIHNSKSDLSYWLNDRKSNLLVGVTTPGCEKVKIQKIEKSYGRILMHCISEKDGKTKVICLDPENKMLPQLSIGRLIEIDLNGKNRYSIDEQTCFYGNVYRIAL